MHLVETQTGTLRTYGPDGDLLDEWETVFAGAVEPTSGLFAVADGAGDSLVSVIDPDTGTVTPLSITSRVTGLSWIDGPDTLLLDLPDGRLQLWDVAADQPRGQLLRSQGGAAKHTLYDPETRSVWIAVDGQLLQLPLDPGVWVTRACEFVDRDLTQAEWDRLVPGGGEVMSAAGDRA